jgi:hypothetical protein
MTSNRMGIRVLTFAPEDVQLIRHRFALRESSASRFRAAECQALKPSQINGSSCHFPCVMHNNPMDFHGDPVIREELIVRYLVRRLEAQLRKEWENHYLECDDCFEEILATELLIRELGEPMVQPRRFNDTSKS